MSDVAIPDTMAGEARYRGSPGLVVDLILSAGCRFETGRVGGAVEGRGWAEVRER
jgi:hypothetical protein